MDRNTELNRFHCTKCGPFVLRPEEVRVVGEGTNWTLKPGEHLTKLGPVCPVCGRENYELASFMMRYGLFGKQPRRKRTKNEDEPKLQLSGSIDCTGRRR